MSMSSWFLRVLALVAVVLGLASVAYSQGSVAHYPFDGDAVDISGNGRDGVVIGAIPAPDRYGIPDKALEFDGVSSQVQVDGFPILNATFSIAAWLTVTGDNTRGDLQSFCVLGTEYDMVTWNFTYNNLSRSWDLWDNTPDGWYIDYSCQAPGNTIPWTFVVIVYGNNSKSLYVNGSLLATKSIPLPIPPRTDNTLVIGNYPNLPNIPNEQPFKGRIDDVQLFDRALSPVEIAEIYALGGGNLMIDIHPGSCPNPLNPKSRGDLPVAILGTSTVDVRTFDPATIRLNGIAPLRWAYADVGTPAMHTPVNCTDCGVLPGDGRLDLTLKFDLRAVVATLGPLAQGDCRLLTLTVSGPCGSDVSGQDYVTVVGGNIRAAEKASSGDEGEVHLEFLLDANYPNPFNPSTRISFELPDASTVSLAVFDLLGRKIADLAEGEYEAGYHSATWNATGVTSGVYLARFTATSGTGGVVYTKTHKLVLMK